MAKILIVEDEKTIAKDISNTLTRLGYYVFDVECCVKNLIIKAQNLMPDLILMNIMLNNDYTGIEAAEDIMKNYDIPVIYLTDDTNDAVLKRAKVTEAYGYILKPFDERILHTTIEMALYKHQVNKQLKERTLELEEEKKKSNELLHNILPAEIVKELKEKGMISPREFKSATLLFTDFQGFTSLSFGMDPEKLVNELNDIFKAFDSIIEKYGLEKLKTMGDAYLVGGGFPKVTDDHAEKIILAAFEMQMFIKNRNKSSNNNWNMRAGIHTGSIIAGVVGKNKFTYDVWGNTVNIANIMERKGTPGGINISRDTYELVKDKFICEPFGKAAISENENIEMFLVKEKLQE